MSLAVRSEQVAVDRGAVLTKACIRAADRLGMTAAQLSDVIGVSEATVSRMKKGRYRLAEHAKSYELAALVVRLFRSLDAIVDGDGAVMKAWMTNTNTLIGARPVEKITTIAGLVDVIAYLDARRAVG